jgi:hypothetical protein
VACGSQHSVAISKKGILHVWGSNDSGQLGLGDTSKRTTPQELRLPEKCTAVACGAYHTLALTADGSIYAWGSNEHGSLGLGDTQHRYIPEKINHPKTFIAIAACWHSLALTTDGELYVWGRNNKAQLGLGKTYRLSTFHPTPILVTFPKKVVQIACGYNHSLALLEDNSLYSWGSNRCGQLGIGYKNYSNTPCKLPEFNGEIQTVIGFGYHSMAVTQTGVFCWGDNTHGNLGIATKTNLSAIPIQITLPTSNPLPKPVRNIVARSPPDLEFPLPSGDNFPDLVLATTDGSEFFWHNTVVGVRCRSLRPYLEFISGMTSTAQKSEILDGAGPTVLDQARFFIYTNKVSLSEFKLEELTSLLRVAKFLEIPELVYICQREFLSSITPNNAYSILFHISRIPEVGEELNWTVAFLSNNGLLPLSFEDLRKLPDHAAKLVYQETANPHLKLVTPEELPRIEIKPIRDVLKKLVSSHSEEFDYKLRVVSGNEKKVFLVHKVILSKWPFFTGTLIKNGADSATHKTTMPLKTFGKLLQFFYYRELDIFSFHDGVWISSLAKFYHLEQDQELLRHCAAIIDEEVSPANWKENLKLGIELNSVAIQECAVKVVLKSVDEIPNLVELMRDLLVANRQLSSQVASLAARLQVVESNMRQ